MALITTENMQYCDFWSLFTLTYFAAYETSLLDLNNFKAFQSSQIFTSNCKEFPFQYYEQILPTSKYPHFCTSSSKAQCREMIDSTQLNNTLVPSAKPSKGMLAKLSVSAFRIN